MSEHIYNIPTGVLKLNIDSGNPDHLFRVEARNNPKRGFLFVSKVLGKHIAVNANQMDTVYSCLAEKAIMPLDRNKKTLVIGMAETATLLGFGVYSKLKNFFSDKSLISYLQSTRYPAENALPFEEAHSHAPSQFIHLQDPEQYEQVVLVDDELSTGNTFVGFEKILQAEMKNLSKITWVGLTDFRKADIKASQKPLADITSLLTGEWSFEWKNRPESLPAACENINSVKATDIHHVGRYDTISQDSYALEAHVVEAIKAIQPKGKVLVVGSGEFMPLPYVLLEHVKAGYNAEDIFFQATTRSPALMKGLSWECDHYKEGVVQYIYNYDRADYDTVLLCVETETNDIVQKMAKDMGAEIISWKK